jgi:hypothetical protein
MPRKEEPTTTCNFCKRGRVIKRTEEIAFRQPSDIGYIRCRVTVSIGFCDVCEATSVDPEVDKILEQASARILSCFAAPAPLPPACRGDSIGGGLLLVTMACRCATAPAWFILLLPTCLDANENRITIIPEICSCGLILIATEKSGVYRQLSVLLFKILNTPFSGKCPIDVVKENRPEISP